jgi:WhiB family transcriptional regulator, redox-sensing transcriptional regulator
VTEHHFPVFNNPALCAEVDPEVWFPEDGRNHKYKTPEALYAKQLCKRCPALAECREYALRYTGLYGIWGALDPTQRRDIQKQLNIIPVHVLATTPNMNEGFRDGVSSDAGRI